MKYLIRVHQRRQPGEQPNFARDVRHFNADDLGQAVARYQAESRKTTNSQVELFVLIETTRPTH